jgi:dimethylglycine dehydrogenase
LHGVTDDWSDARGSEPIYKGGKPVGRATNGGYGWRCGKSLALAMVEPEHAAVGTSLEIGILGKTFGCTVIPESPWDAGNERLRG